MILAMEANKTVQVVTQLGWRPPRAWDVVSGCVVEYAESPTVRWAGKTLVLEPRGTSVLVTLSIGHNGVLAVERSGTLKCRQLAANWQN